MSAGFKGWGFEICAIEGFGFEGIGGWGGGAVGTEPRAIDQTRVLDAHRT